jgi:hypothetical protein
MAGALARKLLYYCLAGVVLVAPVVCISYWPVDGFYDIGRHPIGVDFVNIWSAPQIAVRYGVASVFDPDAYYAAVAKLFRPDIDLFVWVYPPSALLLAAPFSLMPYWLGLMVWTVCGFAAFATAVLTQPAPIARTYRLIFLLLAPASIITIVAGQNGFYTAALLLGGVALLERRPWVAGALFGLLAIKPHLAVLVPFALIVIGAWRAMASAALSASILIAVSVVVWGADAWVAWLAKTVPYTYHELEQLRGFRANMMPSVFASIRASGFSVDVARLAQGIFALAAIVVTPIAFRRTEDVGLRALILSSGTLLVSPYAFHYDMTAMTGAILWVIMSRQLAGPVHAWIFGAAWVLPAAIYYLHILHVGASPLIIGAVFAAAVSQALRGSRGEQRVPHAAPNATFGRRPELAQAGE